MDVSPLSSPQMRSDSDIRRNSFHDRTLPALPLCSVTSTTTTNDLGTTLIEKHPSVPVWPEQPQAIQRGGWLSALAFMGDTIITLTSTAFIVFGSLVLHFDGVPTSEVSPLSVLNRLAILSDASRVGPTVFPILFAATVGSTMHKLAHWRLERGERMKVLDQLLGSTALFSTIATQLKFRNMGFVGLSLILLWILSPLGGQASLRALDYGSISLSQSRTMYHLDWNSTFQASQITLDGPDSSESKFVADSLFMSALSSTKDVQQSGMDSWGNLKIPMLERLSSAEEQGGWRSVANSTNVTYSSLIGIPISTPSSLRNTTMTLETSYWMLECPILYHRPWNATGPRLAGENLTDSSDENPGWLVSTSGSWGMSAKLSPNAIFEYDKNLTRRVINYFGYDDDSGKSSNQTAATCYMSTSYVEVEAECMRKNCIVTRIRPSTQPHPPPEFALGLDPYNANFVRMFQSSAAVEVLQRPTPLQRFFITPYSPFTSLNKDLRLYSLPKVSFAATLAQLMNTYWLASINLGQTTSGLPPDKDILPTDLQRNMSLADQQLYRTINATESLSIPVVKCQRAWLAVLFVATGVMLIAGIFGLVLEATRKVPDFSLNVSSLTRDNPYIRLPSGGSTLDSLDRGRLLQNVRIRMGDVRPGDAVGYIAIASCDGKGRVERLREMERARTFS